ncbi:hypothetical protein SJ05684_b47630 (plasmid) [Sinorhizobium sojae CCBAU 05684]|uniref:Uncharacterized protein n=1 Tax=Sinorhizobium sojae CCBAU 05684 TaxID=716928 RepID=A0A249PJ46_9HYPH|nr:hypothetical protein SJ05684_b47630 [Sinorhizobium sojae CCBAU 05684]
MRDHQRRMIFPSICDPGGADVNEIEEVQTSTSCMSPKIDFDPGTHPRPI